MNKLKKEKEVVYAVDISKLPSDISIEELLESTDLIKQYGKLVKPEGTASDAIGVIYDFKEEVIRQFITASKEKDDKRASAYTIEINLCDILINKICTKYSCKTPK